MFQRLMFVITSFNWAPNTSVVGYSLPSALLSELIQVHKNTWKYSLLAWFQAFRRCVKDIFALMGCHAAQIGNQLPPFRNYLSIPSSTVKQSKKTWTAWPLKMLATVCPETSATTNLRYVTFQKSQDLFIIYYVPIRNPTFTPQVITILFIT